MKTPLDPRHKKRIHLMQKLFALGFSHEKPKKDIRDILPYIPVIDERIGKAAPQWPVDKIAKIDLAILRLAVWELTVARKEPPKVVIDEAVELAKSFGNENSPKFVNGALGTILASV